jgi:hypothetical protein
MKDAFVFRIVSIRNSSREKKVNSSELFSISFLFVRREDWRWRREEAEGEVTKGVDLINSLGN